MDMYMSWKLLEKITSGFSDEIGRGTFGKVYKGKDEAGQEIAVKVLHDNEFDIDGNMFQKEFNNLNRLKHPNIVRLVGFCNDEEDQAPIEHNGGLLTKVVRLRRALCFEYLNNGSLQKHLSDDHRVFDWQSRYKIIKGICMGLKYLHTGLECPVYHLDLKPDNILLGDEKVPKIADFGLSRLIGEKQTHKQTLNAVGTLGYLPLEFVKNQIISLEFDIFSLGVIIIKIICGPKAYTPEDDKKRTFSRQEQKKWMERLQGISGYTSVDVECQCNQVKKCIEIALDCTNTDRQRRPNIGYIIDQLSETEKHMNDKADSLKESDALTSLPNHLPATFFKEITLDFAIERELGRSAFGTLYKGILPEGGIVAVNRHKENMPLPSGTIISTEVANLMRLEHENIVRLVGFCYEPQTKVIEHNSRNVIIDVTESCLCYEYLPNGSLDNHIYGTSSIDWDTRFKIITGICQGVRFLHKELDGPLIHRNLALDSIWLDDNWVPKLANFGFSRLFGQEQTRMNTMNVIGHKGYLAPEYLYRGEISTRSDIYSLGIIILEMTTRLNNNSSDKDMGARDFIDKVREEWTSDKILMENPSLDENGLVEVESCIAIGLNCMDVDQNKRPSIVDIVDTLSKIRADTSSPDENAPTGHLQVYPQQLRFPYNTNKSNSCPLRLTNTTDDYVAARLVTNNPMRYVAATLLCGVVPPRSSYTLVVTTKEHKQLDADEVLSLESCLLRNKGVNLENAGVHSVGIALKKIFREAKGSGADNVKEQRLNVGYDIPKLTRNRQPFEYEIEIISDKKLSQAICVDVHPVEPWIITSHCGGDIFIWDYQKPEAAFHFTHKTPVNSVRFIGREEWFVAGDGEGIIHVYSYYATDQKITSFKAHEGSITSLAVHPTDPLVISSSEDHLIKLWDWDNGWRCIRTFEGHSETVMQVIFNPVDTDSFASASLDETFKIWNISSSECKKTVSDDLVGLPSVLTYTGDTGQCLVTGSWDNGTTQIWDLETETCVQTLEGHTDRISSVYHHPELPIILTGSHDGTVRTWNSGTYRLRDIFGIKLGIVSAFGYIKSVKRVVVACHQGIAIMEMK